mgnify:CR=1 FL=1
MKNSSKEWGYTVDDARWLQAEIERQGRERYLSGQYELGKLNMFGQRINIRVTIPRKDGFGDISFVTGLDGETQRTDKTEYTIQR